MSLSTNFAVNNTFKTEFPESYKENCYLNTLWNVVSVIIFPIGLARLAASGVRTIAAYNIVPALDQSDTTPVALKKLRKELLSNLNGERIRTIQTPDGHMLDAVFFTGRISDKVILYAPGNFESYEVCQEKVSFLLETGASVMMVNRRGVIDSQGFPTARGLPLDTYSAYEYLIKQRNIDPNHILGFGYSLGGSDINRGAALIQKKYPDKKMNVINERSFHKLSEVARALVTNFMKGYRIFGNIAAAFIRAIGWEVDSREGWDQLKGKKCVIYHPLDGVILGRSSLFRDLTANKAHLKGVKVIALSTEEELHRALPHQFYHCRSFSDAEKTAVLDTCRKFLEIN